MLQTAEQVAKHYDISRERQDEYGVRSQVRAAKAQADGRFEAEIAPMKVTMGVVDEKNMRIGTREVLLSRDEGIRPDTTIEGVVQNPPCHAGWRGQCRQCQSVFGWRRRLRGHGLQSWPSAGTSSRWEFSAVSPSPGCEPEEMGIGPVFAIPRLLERTGVKLEDVGLWEFNEAFAVQVLYCRDQLGIPDDRLNVDGGAIAVGHPYGASRVRD